VCLIVTDFELEAEVIVVIYRHSVEFVRPREKGRKYHLIPALNQ